MKNKTSKAKFNFVDVFIIGLILALIAAGTYKLFFVNRGLAAQNGNIEFSVLVEKVRQPTVEGYKEGQIVRDVQTNIVLGKVIHNQPSPYKQAVPTLDGRVVLADVPELYNAIVTISSPAIVTDNNITIGNKEIKTGAPIQIKTNTVSSTGIVYGVTVK
ncbi:MAG: DUF4330 domain-containing protein [Desulfotomaculaceae bacterium]|nr:DUF4330 domain-containing protein [Desulfotomaculaceae bacterium]